jgi:DNA-directed RNA polymerase subunit RPC12/RpoP
MMGSDRAKWELGGLVDANGRLGRALPSGRLLVPAKVQLTDGHLEWEGYAKSTVASVTMLEQFLVLAEGPDEQILRFARRWGPMFNSLAQCDWDEAARDYEMPAGYKRTHYHDPDRSGTFSCRWYLFEGGIDGGRESLRIWRKYARRARGMLRIAAALNGGNSHSPTGDRYDWQCVLEVEEHPESTIDDGGYDWRDPADARFLLSQQLDWWLYLAGCRPSLVLGSSSPIALDGDGLFGAIGLQLAFAASLSRGLALCATCGTAFSPRRLQAGRAAYCRSCGPKAARREASRRYRERQRSAG